jgi:hypothetical protein
VIGLQDEKDELVAVTEHAVAALYLEQDCFRQVMAIGRFGKISVYRDYSSGAGYVTS